MSKHRPSLWLTLAILCPLSKEDQRAKENPVALIRWFESAQATEATISNNSSPQPAVSYKAPFKHQVKDRSLVKTLDFSWKASLELGKARCLDPMEVYIEIPLYSTVIITKAAAISKAQSYARFAVFSWAFSQVNVFAKPAAWTCRIKHFLLWVSIKSFHDSS